MNVQQLRYLVAVTDHGSVSAAARSLQVTQPVISRSIRAFETEHGVQVFGRSGRRLVPTDAGCAVVDAARRALAAFDAVGQSARAAAGQMQLTIATTPTNGLLITPALGAMGHRDAALEIRVCRADDAVDVVSLLMRAEASIGFLELVSGVSHSPLASMPIADLEVVLVSPVGSELPAAVTWNDLVDHPLILPPVGSDRRVMIDDMATSSSGSTPQAALVIEDRGSWMAAAQAGIGSFLSYRRITQGFVGVEIRPFAPRQTVTVGFIFWPGRLSRPAELLIELTRAHLSEQESRTDEPLCRPGGPLIVPEGGAALGSPR